MKKTMDGNEAAAYASYAFTEVAAIYPITPSSPMAEHVDEWAAQGKENIFGQKVELVEMQSEAGAVAAVHGALDGGSLATTYTSSQGLMLMIPTMFRIAGQLKPCVIHVASRTVATHAISIFAEHSDVMACRQTGFAVLASSSVQQAMDLGAVAHLSAISGHVPFLHFHDGFNTSHEIQKIDCLDYEKLKALVDWDALERFRQEALDPEKPVVKTVGLNSDTYFQSREASNLYYERLPDVVEHNMAQIGAITGREYHLFDYYGSKDAEYLMVGMGSLSGTAQETVDALVRQGEKVAYVDVHLFRPFSIKHFKDAVPDTVKCITVLDRTKEPGAVGEPLYEEVSAALRDMDRSCTVLACRYGLAGKDTTPNHLLAVVRNMQAAAPRNHVTLGIEDDVTFHSLAPVNEQIAAAPDGTMNCKFWGLGSDGTVGANKNTIKIIGDHTDLEVQAYFEYDGKKSGGVTRSHLRFGKQKITSAYLIHKADFVACHNQAYLEKYDMVQEVKPGGTFLLACSWTEEQLAQRLPAAVKRYIAENHIQFYIIDAERIARELGMGGRTNTILQAAFFKVSGVMDYEKAVVYMKQAARHSYEKKGEEVVAMNCAAIDAGGREVRKVTPTAEWLAESPAVQAHDTALPRFVTEILEPVNHMKGDTLPVSKFMTETVPASGTYPAGTSQYEKRCIAPQVPAWNKENCIQCNQCAYVCPHAAIRPVLLTREEQEKMPASFDTIDANGRYQGMKYRIQVDVADCTGCGSCVSVCPAREKALSMCAFDAQRAEMDHWEAAMTLPDRDTGFDTVKDSQFRTPLLEFSGACAGCGETPYAKLVTQLFGDHMLIATATGCSQVWATSFPSFPYTTNKKGQGPAMAGSLFENNAEFGFGISMGAKKQRETLRRCLEKIQLHEAVSSELKQAIQGWLDTYDDGSQNGAASQTLREAMAREKLPDELEAEGAFFRRAARNLRKKSVWIFGGDGWAYDIGFGGLDHVLALGEDVNIMVFDTELYSNTGGQSSKATPAGALAKFAGAGKRTQKKDLGLMAMSYGNVYVAQVSMGANPAHLLRCVVEAEAYRGPSLIICYAPCINHGLKCGMANAQAEMKRAVEVGYWPLYHFDPRRREDGKAPFVLDSKEPAGDYLGFLRGEGRYAALEKYSGELAERLYQENMEQARQRYRRYQKLAQEESHG